METGIAYLLITLILIVVYMYFKLYKCEKMIEKITNLLNIQEYDKSEQVAYNQQKELNHNEEILDSSASEQKEENISIKEEWNPQVIPENQEEVQSQEIVQDTEQTEHIQEPEISYVISEEPINYIDDEEDIEKQTIKIEKSDIENIFLGNVFNIIGAFALIISCIIFLSFITYTPLLKTIIGCLGGLGMIMGSFLIKKDTLKLYKEILIGTGFSVLFITIFLSTVLFETFSVYVCSVLGFLILIGAFYIADKQKTVSMLAIALLGGYMNILIGASEIDINLIFGYFIFLNILSMAFVYKNPSKLAMNPLNLVVTFLLTTIIQFQNGSCVSIIYPVILWAIYLVYDFAVKTKKIYQPDDKNFLNWTNFAILTIFSILIFKDAKLNIAYLLIASGFVYLGLVFYFIKHNMENVKPYLYSLVITMLAAGLFLDGIPRIALWSIFAVFLSVMIWKYKQNYLVNWILVFLSTAIVSIFISADTVYSDDYTIILNSRLLTFIFPIAAAFVSYNLINKSDDKNCLKMLPLLKFQAISLIYVYSTFEINEYITNYLNYSSDIELYNKFMTYSIIGFIYSIHMKQIAIINKSELFNKAAYIIGIIALIILLLTNCNNASNELIPVFNIRLIGYSAAITTAVLYSKWTQLEVYKYLAAVLGFFLFHTEAVNISNHFDIDFIVSISWILYAGIITTIGIIKKEKAYRISGIIVSLLALIKICMYDLANVDIVYKSLIFIVLGIIFMVTSYLYNKTKE